MGSETVVLQRVNVANPDSSGGPKSGFARLTDTPIHILAIYLTTSLFLPGILLTVYSELWPFFYHYQDLAIVPAAILLGTIVIACVVRHMGWARQPVVSVVAREIFIFSTQRIRIGILLFAIAVALFNLAIGNAGYRYAETGLSEAGSTSLYFYALVPMAVKLLLVFHAFIYHGDTAVDRFERGLVTFALVCSVNGTGTAFVAVFSFMVLQANARSYLFAGEVTFIKTMRLLGLVGLIVFFLFFAYVLGESIKRQSDLIDAFDWLTGASAGSVFSFNIAVNRISPAYASLINTLPLTFDFARDSTANMVAVFNNFLFRLDTLFSLGLGVDRGDGVSIMRLNYELIDIYALNAREGTAPGLIPGFLYCFPPFINLAMLGIYCYMILGMLQRLCLCMNENLSLIGKLILTYFTLPLFESPLDFLMIIDDGPIYFVGLWWMGRLVKRVPVAERPLVLAPA